MDQAQRKHDNASEVNVLRLRLQQVLKTCKPFCNPALIYVYMCVSVIFTISCQRHKLLTADGACFLTGRDAQGRAEGDLKHVRDQKLVKRLMVGKNAPACPWNFVVVI